MLRRLQGLCNRGTKWQKAKGKKQCTIPFHDVGAIKRYSIGRMLTGQMRGPCAPRRGLVFKAGEDAPRECCRVETQKPECSANEVSGICAATPEMTHSRHRRQHGGNARTPLRALQPCCCLRSPDGPRRSNTCRRIPAGNQARRARALPNCVYAGAARALLAFRRRLGPTIGPGNIPAWLV